MVQKSVELNQPIAVAGKLCSTVMPVAATAPTGGFKAGTNGLILGRFCWRNATNTDFVDNTGTGAPLGFLILNGTGVGTDYTQEAYNEIGAGHEVAPMAKCEIWLEAPSAATVGQKVFAVLADGTYKLDAAGATVAGAIETDFIVKTSNASGALIKVSNWS